VMPEVMEASMKAVEKIKDIRILDMGGGRITGLPGAAGANGAAGGGLAAGGSLPDSITQSLLNYRMQAPIIDEMLTELGFDAGQNPNTMLHRLAENIAGAKAKAAVAKSGQPDGEDDDDRPVGLA